MAHETHPRIAGPALFVLIADDVLEVRVGVLSQKSLDEVTRFLGCKPEEDPDTIDVPCVQTDGMTDFSLLVLELQEVIGAFWCTSDLVRSLEAEK